LFVDIDPRRPSGIPADDREQIRGWLSSQGWPMPIEAASGNGAYLFYRIDLANNEGATDLVRRCLQPLAWRFDTTTVTVDTSCYNAARIAKLIGTLSGKGGGTDRPHWLELHRAGTLRLHRVTRERGPLSVRRACCSVTGTIQPAILARSLDDESLAAGLGARFLLAMPPPKKRRWSEAEASEDLSARYARLLADLLALTLVDERKRRPHVLALDACAKQV
jgi:hypothetical protein